MSRLGFLFIALAALPTAANATKVLSSVKPIQLIANEITQGISESDVLMSTNTSPHDYALKPSDVKKLRSADLVVWVGPDLENFLQGMLSDHKGSLMLSGQEGVTMRKYGGCGCDGHDHHDHHDDAHQAHDDHDHSGHEHESHDSHDHHANTHQDHDSHDHDAHDDHGHSHGSHDPHIWLGPKQAEQIAEAVAHKLVEIDPANAAAYQNNLIKFRDNLSLTVSELTETLAPVKEKGYYVFHDAYGYYEKFFELNNLGHFTVSPDRKPGAKTLNKIRKKLESNAAYCVFSEPQFTPAVVNSVTRGTDVNRGELDPLAIDVTVQSGAYFDFLKSLGSQFKTCLSE